MELYTEGVPIVAVTVAGAFPWASVQKNFFTIDYEGLYDEPYVHAVGEIARATCPITFQ